MGTPLDKLGPMNRMPRDEATCRICLSIMVQPVTFPCHHSLCKQCFGTHINETSLNCPFCRRRLSVWCRKATKENSLVHTELWDRIQQEYPEEVAARLRGDDSQDPLSQPATPTKIDGTLAAPGEIRKEFDNILTQFNQEVETERLKQLEATKSFLRELEETEGPAVETQLESDFELAKKLHDEEQTAKRALAIALRKRNETPSAAGSISASQKRPSTPSATSTSKRASGSYFSRNQSTPKRPCHNRPSARQSSSRKQPSIMNFFEKIIIPAASATAADLLKHTETDAGLTPPSPCSSKLFSNFPQQATDKARETQNSLTMNQPDQVPTTEIPEKVLSVYMGESDYEDETFDELDLGRKYPGLVLPSPKMLTSSQGSESSEVIFDVQTYLASEQRKRKQIEEQEEADRKIASRMQRDWNTSTYVERQYKTRHAFGNSQKTDKEGG